MAQVTVTSGLFSINWKDAAKGVVVAAVSSVLSAVYTALTVTPLVFDFKQIGIVGLTAGVAYLVKNFLTPAQLVTPADAPDPSDPNKPQTGKPGGN